MEDPWEDPLRTPTRVSLGELDLTGLDLIHLDLDELTEIASSQSKQMSPDDAFGEAKRTISIAHRGQDLYAESLTSGDGSGSNERRSSRDSFRSNASESSFSSRSSASSMRSDASRSSNRSGNGSTKRLIALGLGAAEVVELRTLKKSRKKDKRPILLPPQQQQQQQQQQQKQKQQQKQHTMTEQQQSKQIRQDYLLSLRQVAVGPPPPLTTDEMSRIINTIPRLSKLAVANISTVLDRITTKHQRLLLRHSRRFEYEFRSRFLGGKKKDKKTGERVSVLLGEFMSKHVFMPKTQHLIKNGDILFLQLFNMFLHEQWDEISILRKDIGFHSFRSDESLETILDNLHNEMMLIGDVSNGKNGYWLKGLAVEKKKEKVVLKETREERKRKKELRKIKRREEHENKKLVSKSRKKNDDDEGEGIGKGTAVTTTLPTLTTLTRPPHRHIYIHTPLPRQLLLLRSGTWIRL